LKEPLSHVTRGRGCGFQVHGEGTTAAGGFIVGLVGGCLWFLLADDGSLALLVLSSPAVVCAERVQFSSVLQTPQAVISICDQSQTVHIALIVWIPRYQSSVLQSLICQYVVRTLQSRGDSEVRTTYTSAAGYIPNQQRKNQSLIVCWEGSSVHVNTQHAWTHVVTRSLLYSTLFT
jgi:hypothetical protein